MSTGIISWDLFLECAREMNNSVVCLGEGGGAELRNGDGVIQQILEKHTLW
jgi:hypothetical protein